MKLKELIKLMETCKSDLRHDFQQWYSQCYDLKFAAERAVNIIVSPRAEKYWLARLDNEINKKVTSDKVIKGIAKDLEKI